MKRKVKYVKRKSVQMMKIFNLISVLVLYITFFIYYGVSTRPCDFKFLLVSGSFENVSWHDFPKLYRNTDFLQVDPLRLLLAHDRLYAIIFKLSKDLVTAKRDRNRQIRRQTDVDFFDHNLNRIIRMGCLFENHPT